jgi:hypothetical protein
MSLVTLVRINHTYSTELLIETCKVEVTNSGKVDFAV